MIEITDYQKLWQELNDRYDLILIKSEMQDLVNLVHKYSSDTLNNMKNKSAFPFFFPAYDWNPAEHCYGLTKLQYFSGFAMQGLLSSTIFMKSIQNDSEINLSVEVAMQAIHTAKELVEQLETEEKGGGV